MGIIELDVDLVPYTFNIELSERIYTLNINYNFIYDYFTMDLLLNEKVLVEGEKLVLNEILFREAYEDKDHNLNEEFPSELLMPISDNNDTTRISISNLGKEVQLYYFDRSDIIE